MLFSEVEFLSGINLESRVTGFLALNLPGRVTKFFQDLLWGKVKSLTFGPPLEIPRPPILLGKVPVLGNL